MTDNNNNTVSLPEKLDLTTVGEIHKTLLAMIEKNESVVLDISALKDIDTAGVQLLSVAVKDEKGSAIRLSGKSESFETLAGVMGMSDHFKAHWEH